MLHVRIASHVQGWVERFTVKKLALRQQCTLRPAHLINPYLILIHFNLINLYSTFKTRRASQSAVLNITNKNITNKHNKNQAQHNVRKEERYDLRYDLNTG